jgi:hypothetical protein
LFVNKFEVFFMKNFNYSQQFICKYIWSENILRKLNCIKFQNFVIKNNSSIISWNIFEQFFSKIIWKLFSWKIFQTFYKIWMQKHFEFYFLVNFLSMFVETFPSFLLTKLSSIFYRKLFEFFHRDYCLFFFSFLFGKNTIKENLKLIQNS